MTSQSAERLTTINRQERASLKFLTSSNVVNNIFFKYETW